MGNIIIALIIIKKKTEINLRKAKIFDLVSVLGLADWAEKLMTFRLAANYYYKYFGWNVMANIVNKIIKRFYNKFNFIQNLRRYNR